MKKLIVVILLALLFSGCRSVPEEETMRPVEESFVEETAQTRHYQSEFFAADGLISFQLDLKDFPMEYPELPVLQVTPKSITADTAKRVASVLFDEAVMYEYAADPAELCRWSFYPISHYTGLDGVDTASGEFISYNKTNSIQAAVTASDLPYQLMVWSRDEADYRMQSIDTFIRMEEFPGDQYAELLCELCGERPDSMQTEHIKEKAVNMIGRMEIGEWQIDSCEVLEVPINVTAEESVTTYQVRICAAPVYNGVPVVRQNQLMNLKTGDALASNYYYEDLIFTFAPDGRLIEFSYKSPLRVVSTIQEAAALISPDEMLERMQAYLEASDAADWNPYEAFGIPAYQAGKIDVCVDEIKIGLTRTRIPNNVTDFYLLPAATVRGSCQVYDTAGNLIYDSRDPFFAEERRPFLVMNLLDGSVIEVDKGY